MCAQVSYQCVGECRCKRGWWAYLATEMFLVPYLTQRLHAVVSDRFAALTAGTTEQLLIVHLAVWEAILLIKLTASEGRVTMVTTEVFGVPHSSHSREGTANDRFTTSYTKVLHVSETDDRKGAAIDLYLHSWTFAACHSLLYNRTCHGVRGSPRL